MSNRENKDATQSHYLVVHTIQLITLKHNVLKQCGNEDERKKETRQGSEEGEEGEPSVGRVTS